MEAPPLPPPSLFSLSYLISPSPYFPFSLHFNMNDSYSLAAGLRDWTKVLEKNKCLKLFRTAGLSNGTNVLKKKHLISVPTAQPIQQRNRSPTFINTQPQQNMVRTSCVSDKACAFSSCVQRVYSLCCGTTLRVETKLFKACKPTVTALESGGGVLLYVPSVLTYCTLCGQDR